MNSRHLKSNETLLELSLAMRKLAQKGSLDDSLIEYVINGIPPSNKLILYGAKTLREFKEKQFFKCSQNYAGNLSRQTKRFTRNFYADKRRSRKLPVCYSCGMRGHKSMINVG